eukprot:gene115-biopygen3421
MRVCYGDFIDKDLKHFSNYDVLRSVPSVVDGLKVSQRKALFGCFKRCGPSNDNYPEARVTQLAAYVAEHSLFHHGEASMQGTIIAMAQNFMGAGNNLNLLQPIGQFGSRLGGGSDHASPRYIHTSLEPVTRALFPREDDRVLEYLTDDGTSVEPRFYAPIIPLVLANGADGIGTGYSTHIPCFDPRDLVIAIRERICGTERITKLKPWYKGFRGEVGGIRVNGREVITGSVVKVGATKARITELPVGVWIDDFKETLENFVGDNAKGVKGFSNESTEDNVSFTITFSNSATASSWLQVNTTQDSEAHDDDIGYGDTVNGLTRLEIELKMYVCKPLCMTNMHLFDASGRIRKYSSPEEILDEFLEQRMKVYVQRKAWLERELAETLRVLEQKVRFVELVVTGELDVFKEVVDDNNDNDDIDEVEDDDDSSDLDSSSMQQGTISPDATERKRVHALERHGLECVKGSFRYLLSMPVSCLTWKRKYALERERDARRTELEAVRVTDEKDMYIRDLERLEKFLIKKRYVKSYNVADNGIYGLENIAYNKVVPNISVKGEIRFQTPKTNNTDNYTLRKVVHGVDKSSLRLTINDDSDEVFEIWGDSCASGGCGGEGAVAHKFTADGNAWHKGAEVVACFFFHILGSLSPTPWCNAATLSIMVLATARISGAHLNPCVTWVFTLMGYTHPHEAVLYAVSQYVGCVLGAIYLSLMISGVSVGGPGLGCFSPSEGITDRRVLAIEGLGTFVFTLCVFAVVWCTQNKHGYGTIGPIMIGLALLAPALAIGPLTGGAMNPARVLASPTVFNEGAGCKGEFLGVYVGAEMLGATLSAICVLLCFGVAEVPWYPYSVRKVIRHIVEAARHPPFVTYSLVRGD